jgi:hypothetical protein
VNDSAVVIVGDPGEDSGGSGGDEEGEGELSVMVEVVIGSSVAPDPHAAFASERANNTPNAAHEFCLTSPPGWSQSSDVTRV